MAGTILLLGKLAFALIGVAVGIRLAGETIRSGVGLHTVALAAICIGGVGLLAMPAAQPLESVALVLVGELAVRIAMLLLCAFIACTFRPGPAGVAAAVGCAVLLLSSLVWDLRAQASLLDYDYTQPSSHANQLTVAVPFAWSAVESFLLWARARRRLALGLSDANLVRQYLLWTITTGCFVAIAGLAIASGLAQAAGAAREADLAQALRGVLYFVITACVWRGIFSHRVEEPAAVEA